MNTLLYRLKLSEDPLEKDTYVKMSTQFPLFEKLEIEYLNELKDINGNWREDTLPNLEEIGMCQYGVLKSINFINKSKLFVIAGDPNQRYKNIYFHFGLIFDIVENMARNIVLTQSYLNIRKYENKINKDKLGDKELYLYELED